MKAFEYAAPRSESEVLDLLDEAPGHTEILAGGTDLIPLMKKMLARPERVVNIMDVAGYRGVESDSQGVTLGAATPLDELLDHPTLAPFPAISQAIRGMNSPQLQAQGTLGGDLCVRPACWYFRNGQGLLPSSRTAERTETRFHAIFGNAGPAKFVSATRLAPALIALGAQVRVAGPGPNAETWLPLEALYRTPRHAGERELALASNQVLTHVRLPEARGLFNGAYEVRQSVGPDYPLVAAAAALEMSGDRVSRATIVLGHVAPTPWLSPDASRALAGRVLDRAAAQAAGEAAAARATPLVDNRYKVQLTRVAVERAILLAGGMETGGF